ncbi:MAG: hypothetical protein QNJ70_17605 [Xenococcaceae cyanobacterium MO_207.B15]|nr:hypothetical protein [Xenococcaceae cyanobacterium MO_207.B15]
MSPLLKDLGAELITEIPGNLKKLGIDEIAVVKGQRNYYVVLVDLEKKKYYSVSQIGEIH